MYPAECTPSLLYNFLPRLFPPPLQMLSKMSTVAVALVFLFGRTSAFYEICYHASSDCSDAAPLACMSMEEENAAYAKENEAFEKEREALEKQYKEYLATLPPYQWRWYDFSFTVNNGCPGEFEACKGNTACNTWLETLETASNTIHLSNSLARNALMKDCWTACDDTAAAAVPQFEDYNKCEDVIAHEVQAVEAAKKDKVGCEAAGCEYVESAWLGFCDKPDHSLMMSWESPNDDKACAAVKGTWQVSARCFDTRAACKFACDQIETEDEVESEPTAAELADAGTAAVKLFECFTANSAIGPMTDDDDDNDYDNSEFLKVKTCKDFFEMQKEMGDDWGSSEENFEACEQNHGYKWEYMNFQRIVGIDFIPTNSIPTAACATKLEACNGAAKCAAVLKALSDAAPTPAPNDGETITCGSGGGEHTDSACTHCDAHVEGDGRCDSADCKWNSVGPRCEPRTPAPWAENAVIWVGGDYPLDNTKEPTTAELSNAGTEAVELFACYVDELGKSSDSIPGTKTAHRSYAHTCSDAAIVELKKVVLTVASKKVVSVLLKITLPKHFSLTNLTKADFDAVAAKYRASAAKDMNIAEDKIERVEFYIGGKLIVAPTKRRARRAEGEVTMKIVFKEGYTEADAEKAAASFNAAVEGGTVGKVTVTLADGQTYETTFESVEVVVETTGIPASSSSITAGVATVFAAAAALLF